MNLTHNVGPKLYFFAALLQMVVNVAIGVCRFGLGLLMSGKERTDAGWTTTGIKALQIGDEPSWWCYRPRLARAAIRLGVVAGIGAYGIMLLHNAAGVIRLTVAAVVLVAAARVYLAVKHRSDRQFDRYYTAPLAATLAPHVGRLAVEPRRRWLRLSRDLQGLAPPPSKPLSPVEEWVRLRYGTYIEPALLWPSQQLYRASQKAAKSRAGKLAAAFKRPDEERPPCVEVKAQRGYFISKEVKAMINEVIQQKLGPGKDLEPDWDQRGEYAVCLWTAVLEPPRKVGYEKFAEIVDGLEDHQFFAGLNKLGQPHILDLESDSPHFAISAGTGAGKSEFAKLIALQFLRRGGEVLIADYKGTSHPWAWGLKGVTYAHDIEQIHDLFVTAAAKAKRRSREAVFHMQNLEDLSTYNPGARVLVIFEEMNATTARLNSYWAKVREKGEDKTSPAVDGFRELMYMGRSAKYHLFGIAQMLTAKTTGGPESRENFGIRCLARYSRNNWRMLVPECGMPRSSRVPGRWQIAVSGEVTEVQVPFTEDLHEVRRLGVPPVRESETPVPEQAGPGTEAGHVPEQAPAAEELAEMVDPLTEAITLQEGIEAGHVVMPSYAAAKKRINRAQKEDPDNAIWPVEGIKKGNAKCYTKSDLITFFTSATTSERTRENR